MSIRCLNGLFAPRSLRAIGGRLLIPAAALLFVSSQQCLASDDPNDYVAWFSVSITGSELASLELEAESEIDRQFVKIEENKFRYAIGVKVPLGVSEVTFELRKRSPGNLRVVDSIRLLSHFLNRKKVRIYMFSNKPKPSIKLIKKADMRGGRLSLFYNYFLSRHVYLKAKNLNHHRLMVRAAYLWFWSSYNLSKPERKFEFVVLDDVLLQELKFLFEKYRESRPNSRIRNDWKPTGEKFSKIVQDSKRFKSFDWRYYHLVRYFAKKGNRKLACAISEYYTRKISQVTYKDFRTRVFVWKTYRDRFLGVKEAPNSERLVEAVNRLNGRVCGQGPQRSADQQTRNFRIPIGASLEVARIDRNVFKN